MSYLQSALFLLNRELSDSGCQGYLAGHIHLRSRAHENLGRSEKLKVFLWAWLKVMSVCVCVGLLHTFL